MKRQKKSARVAEIIGDMIDLKFREHERKNHFEGDEESVRDEQRQGLLDESKFEANKINLAVAISELFSSK
jgi:hypothetical protein